MSLRTRVEGMDNIRALLRNVDKETRDEVRDAIEASAEMVRETAVESVLYGRKTGKLYRYRRKNRSERGQPADKYFEVKGRKNRQGKPLVIPLMLRDAPHRASAPGEAPAEDFGKMSKSIRTVLARDKFSGVVVARGMGLLEFGTRKVAARPFLFPALLENRKDILRTIDQAVSKAIATADKKRKGVT